MAPEQQRCGGRGYNSITKVKGCEVFTLLTRDLISHQSGWRKVLRKIRAGGGYGRELIEKALPYALNAKTSFELNKDSVRCTIKLPLGLESDTQGSRL